MGRLDCYYTLYAITTETGIFYPKRVFNLTWLRPPVGELKHRQSRSQIHKRMSHIGEDLETISWSLWRCRMPARTLQNGCVCKYRDSSEYTTKIALKSSVQSSKWHNWKVKTQLAWINYVGERKGTSWSTYVSTHEMQAITQCTHFTFWQEVYLCTGCWVWILPAHTQHGKMIVLLNVLCITYAQEKVQKIKGKYYSIN